MKFGRTNNKVLLPSHSKQNPTQRKNGGKKYWRLFLVILAAFFLINIFLRLPHWLVSVERPFAAEPASFANSQKLNLKNRSSLLLVRQNSNQVREVTIVSFDPVGKQIAFISVPTGATFSAGVSGKTTFAQLLRANFDQGYWQLATLIGTPLQGYLVFKDSPDFSQENLTAARKDLFSLSFFASILERKSWLDDHLVTNLTVGEMIAAARSWKGVNSENTSFVDLDKSVGPDGFDPEALADETKFLFVDSQIADETASVKITNGTGVFGFGSDFKQLISNSGARVLSVDTSDSGKTRVIVHGDKKILASTVAKFLNVSVEKGSSGEEEDVEIILGKDLAAKLGFN